MPFGNKSPHETYGFTQAPSYNQSNGTEALVGVTPAYGVHNNFPSGSTGYTAHYQRGSASHVQQQVSI